MPISDNSDSTENSESPNPSEAGLNVRFVRVVRTESSEVYLIWQEESRLGQVDLHFGWDLIHATLIIEKDLTNDQQAELVDCLDQEIVSSHLPRFSREDFLVTVFRARELDPFSDGPDEDDFEDDEDDDY